MYAKVFRALWDGSLCGQADAQLVFVYLLAHAEPDGSVCQQPSVIVTKTGIPLERVEAALGILESTDPASGTESEDGRRILRIRLPRNEWQIVNYLKYRSLRDEQERRRQNREAQARHRLSASVSQRQPRSSQEEGEVEVEVEESKHLSPRRRRSEVEHPDFRTFYENYPRRTKRRAASRAFIAALARHSDWESGDLARAAHSFAVICQRAHTEAQFIPHPSSWLNADQFLEEESNAETTTARR